MASEISGDSRLYQKLIDALRTKSFPSVSKLAQYFGRHLNVIADMVFTRKGSHSKKDLKQFFDIHKNLIFINLQSDDHPKSPLDQWIDVIDVYAQFHLKKHPYWQQKSHADGNIPEPLITALAVHVFGCDVYPSQNLRAKHFLSLTLQKIRNTEFLSQTMDIRRGIPQEFVVDESDPYKRSSYWAQKIPTATEKMIRAEYNLPPYMPETIKSNFTSVLHPQISAIIQGSLPMPYFVVEKFMCDEFKRIINCFTSPTKWKGIRTKIAEIENLKVVEESGTKENMLEKDGSGNGVSLPENDDVSLEENTKKRKMPVNTSTEESSSQPAMLKRLRVLVERVSSASGIEKGCAKQIDNHGISFDKNDNNISLTVPKNITTEKSRNPSLEVVPAGKLKSQSVMIDQGKTLTPQSIDPRKNWLPHVMLEKLHLVRQTQKLSIEDRLDSRLAKILELQPVDQKGDQTSASNNRRITRGQRKQRLNN